MQASASIFYTTRKSKQGKSKPAISLRVNKQERKVEALAVVIGEPHEIPVPLFDAEEFGAHCAQTLAPRCVGPWQTPTLGLGANRRGGF